MDTTHRHDGVRLAGHTLDHLHWIDGRLVWCGECRRYRHIDSGKAVHPRTAALCKGLRHDVPKRKRIITRSDGKMVTIRATLHVLMGIRRPAAVWHPKFYGLAQQAAWIALGTHLLVLGMCTLVTQIYTVVLLVSSTVAISSTTDWSADTQHKTTTPRHDWLSDRITTIPFNDDWDVIKTDPEFRTKGNEGHRKNYQMDRRLVAWARLGLSRQEEVTMISWQLVLEMEKGATWWMEYRCLRDAFAAEGGQNSDACIAPWNMVMRPPASSTET
jgi:hypothetical protein